METLLLVFHIFLCVFLIGIIMLQSGKGADIGAAFGAGGSQTVFGPRGAGTFLSKLTTGLAILFLLTSVSLARLARTGGGKSVFEKVPVGATVNEGQPAVDARPEKPVETKKDSSRSQ